MMSNQIADRPRRALSRRKLFLFTMVATLLSALLAFIVAEGFVRWRMARRPNDIEALKRFDQHKRTGDKMMLIHLVRPSENPKLIYELIPRADGEFKGKRVRINSAGFFDVERQITAPEGTFRIAVLGDSIPFGWGIEMEKRYSDRLERFLNDHSVTGSAVKRYEVLNFGIPGYNTVMEAELLRSKVLAFKPDVISLHFCYDNDAALPNFVSKPRPLYTICRSYLLESLANGGSRKPLEAGVQYSDPKNTPDEYRWMIGWESANIALKQISDISASRRMPAFFMLDYYDLESWRGPQAKPFSEDRAADLLKVVAKSGFVQANPKQELIKALDRFRLKSKDLWVGPDETPPDAHPNAIGHALYAKVLYNAMTQAGALPNQEQRLERLDADLAEWDLVIEREIHEAGH